MKAFIIITSTLLGVFAFAQAPDTLWTRTYGGLNDDHGYSVVHATSGCYVIAGSTESYGLGNYDFWLFKIDENGVVLWTKTYGGTGYDACFSMQQTSDGGYVMAGFTESFGPGVWLIKTDSLGDTLWARTQVGYIGFSVQQTKDGGYIITGQTSEYDVFLVKTDSLGFNQWYQIYYSPLSFDCAYSVQQTLDGGYVIAGYTNSYGASGLDVWLLKTNALGDTLWTRTYGGPDGDEGYCVHQVFDGGYIIVGASESFGAGDYDIYIVKTDSLGDTLWTRTYGGLEQGGGLWIQPTSDSGYIVAGYTEPLGVYYRDAYFLKIDTEGDSVWAKTIGGTGSEMFYSVQQTIDGGYVAAGHTSSYGAGGSDVYVVGLAADTPGFEEYKVSPVKKNRLGSTVISGPLLLPDDNKCRIFDITGRVVEPSKIHPGIYFIEIDGVVMQKVVKVR